MTSELIEKIVDEFYDTWPNAGRVGELEENSFLRSIVTRKVKEETGIDLDLFFHLPTDTNVPADVRQAEERRADLFAASQIERERREQATASALETLNENSDDSDS
jgi:uncharacterized protein (UPF0147 family)